MEPGTQKLITGPGRAAVPSGDNANALPQREQNQRAAQGEIDPIQLVLFLLLRRMC